MSGSDLGDREDAINLDAAEGGLVLSQQPSLSHCVNDWGLQTLWSGSTSANSGGVLVVSGVGDHMAVPLALTMTGVDWFSTLPRMMALTLTLPSNQMFESETTVAN